MNVKSDDLLYAIDVLRQANSEYRYEKICELSMENKEIYSKLLKHFKDSNLNSSCSKNEKGKALEDIVSFLLNISGGLFYVARNLRTTTNEIDQLISLTPKGKLLLANGLLNSKLDIFLGECKNYHGKLSVTYVGKFCSLLITNNVKIGILFSYHGISGSGWNNSSGLIKKFYLSKENEADRFCIINFSINDFESILHGKNLLQIIDEKLNSLRFDTDYIRYLSIHPAE